MVGIRPQLGAVGIAAEKGVMSGCGVGRLLYGDDLVCKS